MERKMPLPPSALAVMNALTARGFDAWVVGGSVRDHLRGQVPHDYDMTTDATPEEMKVAFSGMRVIETGIRHGTVTVLSQGVPYEVTTYRVDGAYADHRHPDGVQFTRDLTGDLARRDFTVNAIAYHPERGYQDPFGGCADMERKVLRAVGNPRLRFEEDALRILRGIRFAATLGFTLEEETEAALLEKKDLLTFVSRERIRDELLKLLVGDCAGAVLRRYRDVLAVCIPQLAPMFDHPQNTPYHCYDVWEHSIRTLEALPPDPLLRLAGLLHDIAKPACHTLDGQGVSHFRGHQREGAEMAREIATALRLDKASTQRLAALVYHHDDRTPPQRGKVLRLLAKVGYPLFLSLCDLTEADIAAHTRGLPIIEEGLVRVGETRALGKQLEREGACYRIQDLSLNGRDVMEHTALRGAQVGEALSTLLHAVMDGKVQNERQALLSYLLSLS